MPDLFRGVIALGEGSWFQSQNAWVQMFALPLIRCVTSAKLLDLSEPQFRNL